MQHGDAPPSLTPRSHSCRDVGDGTLSAAVGAEPAGAELAETVLGPLLEEGEASLLSLVKGDSSIDYGRMLRMFQTASRIARLDENAMNAALALAARFNLQPSLSDLPAQDILERAVRQMRPEALLKALTANPQFEQYAPNVKEAVLGLGLASLGADGKMSASRPSMLIDSASATTLAMAMKEDFKASVAQAGSLLTAAASGSVVSDKVRAHANRLPTAPLI